MGGREGGLGSRIAGADVTDTASESRHGFESPPNEREIEKIFSEDRAG